MTSPDRSEWYHLFLFILKHKKLNIWSYSLLFVLTVVYVFFIMTKQYTADVSILPSASSGTQNLGGKLGSLANLAGVNFGFSTSRSPEMYQGILYSRRLLEPVILKNYNFPTNKGDFTGNLIEFYKITGKSEEEKIQKALKIMRDYIVVTNIDEDNGILYLSVTMKHPILAAEVANNMISILEDIVLNNLQLEFKEQDDYLKNRLALINDSLKITEEELKKFLEKNPDPTVPRFQIEQLRLRRKIEVQSAVFIELTKQLELLNIQNFVNLSPLKILDKAYPPYRKSRPKRIFVVITLMILLGFVQVGVNSLFYIRRKFSSSISMDVRKNYNADNKKIISQP